MHRPHEKLLAIASRLRDIEFDETANELESVMSEIATVINGLIAENAALKAQVPDAADQAAIAAAQALLTPPAPAADATPAPAAS